MVPVELFGRSIFPVVGERPYMLTLGSHVFYWFALQAPPSAGLSGASVYVLPRLAVEGDWEALVQGGERSKLEGILPFYLMHSRWFAGKEKKPKAARIVETLALEDYYNPCSCIIEVEYDEGEPDRYALPLGFYRGEAARDAKERAPERVLAEIGIETKTGHVEGLVCDAMADPR